MFPAKGEKGTIWARCPRARTVLLHTARYQVPGSQVSWHQDTRKAGILASWQLGMGIVAFQEAKMCTESPKISILGCPNVDFLMFLVPCQHGANIANIVLANYPKGATVRLNRHGKLLKYKQDGVIEVLGQIDDLPMFDKLNPNPVNISPGMIWGGPFAGDAHHFCDDRFWTVNTKRKRCHWKQVPEELKAALVRFKPAGGSFLMTPWKHVIALIQPIPLPKEAQEQWNAFSKEEKRLVQIKQKSVEMLPIYICRVNDDWNIELDEPVDYSKPLSEQELGDMMNFLDKFSDGPSPKSEPENKKVEQPNDVEEDWSDDEEFFDEEGLDILYTPSEIGVEK